MRVRTRIIPVVLAAILFAACSGNDGTTVGVVTSVEGALTEVDSFTVLSEGTEFTFLPVEGQDYEFPLDHLREHVRSGEPVAVGWETRDGAKYALTITDG